MIPQENIDDLLQRIDIAEVIGKRVPLNKAGQDEYKGLCPFHSEKTPSFTVNSAKQFYHCFGCGAGGNAIKFLMEHEGKSFHETIDELASSVGIIVPNAGKRRHTKGTGHRSSENLLESVCDAFQENLLGNTPSTSATAYLKKRCISRKTAETFRIGYAPDGWDYVLNKFGTTATERRQLEDSGLIVRKDDKSGLFYDRFRDRLMFPIVNNRNRVVGFGGKALGTDQVPRYLNSPTTATFKKSREIFGLPQAVPGIRATGKVLVVESIMDAVSLHQHGVRNAVACCGTAMSTEQAARLFNVATEIVIHFDGDDAGRTAAAKAAETLLPEMADGKMASIVFMPDGHDPDSLVRSDPKWYEQVGMKTRKPVLEFLLDRIESDCDLSRLDGCALYSLRAAGVIAQLPRNGLLRHIVSDYCVRRSGCDPLAEELSPNPEKQAQ